LIVPTDEHEVGHYDGVEPLLDEVDVVLIAVVLAAPQPFRVI
jgi:hypothetical protein